MEEKLAIRPLRANLQQKAKEDLNEDKTKIEEDLAYIKSWINEQKHLTARTENQWLLSFLRGNKYRYEITKQKLDTYYTARSTVPEFFRDRDPLKPELQEVLKLGVFLPLPLIENSASPRVIIIRTGAHDPKLIHYHDIFKVVFMINDILMMEDDNFVVAGEDLLIDMKGMDMNHVVHFTPTIAKRVVVSHQKAYPVRAKAIHYINTNSVVRVVHNLCCQFLPEKIKQRVKIYPEGDFSDMFKTVPKEIVPKEYGGEGPSFASVVEEWKTKVESYRDWFLEDVKYGTDETKRIGGTNHVDSLFGVEGSFRKLNVD